MSAKNKPLATQIPQSPRAYNAQDFDYILETIEHRLTDLERSVNTYSVTGTATLRTLNVGTATLADVGNFLATLVADLKTQGRL